MTAAAYTVLFYVFAAFAVLLAIGVTNAPRLLRAAVYLMGVLMASAGMYVLLGAEFLAGIQVLVYVGGIVVLIVFAVMLTRSAELQVDNPSPKRKWLAAVASATFLAFVGAVFWTTQFPTANQAGGPSNDVLAIGKALLDQSADGYVLPFEIVSLLLLAALIGGVVVARKTPPPGQPFTSGGDLPGEADFQLPHSQREGRGQSPGTRGE
jgi:NADH-quinone oxidoreductase subunit J